MLGKFAHRKAARCPARLPVVDEIIGGGSGISVEGGFI